MDAEEQGQGKLRTPAKKETCTGLHVISAIFSSPNQGCLLFTFLVDHVLYFVDDL